MHTYSKKLVETTHISRKTLKNFKEKERELGRALAKGSPVWEPVCEPSLKPT